MFNKFAIPLFALVTLPGVALRFGLFSLPHWGNALVFGIAIIGAAFLLTWGSELAQLEVSQGLAIALLALIAVLPEYAIDTIFAWKAGNDPDQFAPLALANMTGANRLLIGVGWPLVVFVAWLAARRQEGGGAKGSNSKGERRKIGLETTQIIEISILILAAAYCLSLPLKPSIMLIDTAILFTIFGFYLWRISRAETEEPTFVGPPKVVAALARSQRLPITIGMLVFAALIILAVAEPFSESLVEVSTTLGISEFFAVQWLAPLASEAPELIAVSLLAWNFKSEEGLGALISSKVNQWTLLVGFVPLVFAVSAGGFEGLPIDAEQREELFLTAAQTLFAASLLLNLSLSLRDAGALLGLFLLQFVLNFVLPEAWLAYQLIGIGVLYLVLALALFIRRGRNVVSIMRHGLLTKVENLSELEALHPEENESEENEPTGNAS